jgi:hypothetical protein
VTVMVVTRVLAQYLESGHEPETRRQVPCQQAEDSESESAA